MKTTLDQSDWDRICYLIKNECRPEANVQIMEIDGGYCITFRGGVIHPASFLDLFDEDPTEEPVDILKNKPQTDHTKPLSEASNR